MADEPDNLVPRALREIRGQNDIILRKLDEVVTRPGAVKRDLAAIKVDHAAMPLRLDDMDRRIGRIERRLDLIEA